MQMQMLQHSNRLRNTTKELNNVKRILNNSSFETFTHTVLIKIGLLHSRRSFHWWIISVTCRDFLIDNFDNVGNPYLCVMCAHYYGYSQ